MCSHEVRMIVTPKINNNFLMFINIFGWYYFLLYLCVGALLCGGKYKAGWSILGPVVNVTIVQRSPEKS
jgi:hypothetical protein